MSDEQTFLQFAQDLAHKAGAIMRDYLQVGVQQEIKSDGSPVTIADTKINQMVIDAVQERYPAHSIISEEANDIHKSGEYAWVCDPIDGTLPFTFGLPISLFSLALVKDGVPVLGILYDPYQDRMYSAVKGQGAYLNDRKLQVSQTASLAGNYMAIPGVKEKRFDSASFAKQVMQADIKTFTLVCVTAEAALVASGQITANVFGGQSPWDIAAAKIIVEEAGGKVTDLAGNEQRYDQPINGAIISNGRVHDELVACLQAYTVDTPDTP